MKAWALLGCVAVPLAVVLARSWVEGERDLAAAARIGDAGEPAARAARVAALGRAVRRLGGPAARARAELAALGRSGDVAAWKELRGSLLATRWLVTPAPALLDEADHALAGARAAERVADGTLPPAQEEAQREVEYRRLCDSDEPSRALSLLGLAGAALFLGGAAALLLRGSRPRRWACALGGLVLYLVGMWLA